MYEGAQVHGTQTSHGPAPARRPRTGGTGGLKPHGRLTGGRVKVASEEERYRHGPALGWCGPHFIVVIIILITGGEPAGAPARPS
jgi:hypothetical protein